MTAEAGNIPQTEPGLSEIADKLDDIQNRLEAIENYYPCECEYSEYHLLNGIRAEVRGSFNCLEECLVSALKTDVIPWIIYDELRRIRINSRGGKTSQLSELLYECLLAHREEIKSDLEDQHMVVPSDSENVSDDEEDEKIEYKRPSESMANFEKEKSSNDELREAAIAAGIYTEEELEKAKTDAMEKFNIAADMAMSLIDAEQQLQQLQQQQKEENNDSAMFSV